MKLILAAALVVMVSACGPVPSPVDGGSGGGAAGGSTAGGSTAGGSTAGGSTAGGSTAGGSTAGGSTAGGSAEPDAGTFVAETGLPTVANLVAVWAGNGVTFAGGVSEVQRRSGVTLQLQGSTWVKTDDERTTAIWGSSSNDVWAAGGATLRRWNGSQWQTYNSSGSSITAIHGSSPTNVWMVEGSLVSHFDGGTIDFGSTPGTGTDWFAVHALAPNDVWVGGQYGRLQHFDGTRWTPHDSGFSSTFSDVRGLWAVGPADVWAVGGPNNSAELSHWNGTTWTAMTFTGAGGLLAIWGSSANDLWAVGQGVIHYDGTAWSRVTVPTTVTLRAVYGRAANDVWAAGGRGTLLHFDGTVWTQVAPTSQSNVTGIWAASTTELFAVGADLLRSSGNGTWVREPNPSQASMVAVHGTSGGDVWAVGADETVLHRSDAGWARVAVPTITDAGLGDGGTTLMDVFAVSSSEVWAVGEAGAVIRWNGAGFTTLPPPSAQRVSTVWAAGPNDVWVGGANLLARWNGTSWAAAPGFTGGVVADVWGRSANDIWAVGGAGLTIDGMTFLVTDGPGYLWHFDGVTWTRTTIASPLTKVWMSGSVIWGAGLAGDLSSFDGRAWLRTLAGTGSITGLTGAGTSVWAVGGGQILRGP